MVVSPTYLLSELVQDHWPYGRHAVSIGLNGGGIRYGHWEYRNGTYKGDESFWGDGAELPLSYYASTKLFDKLPLQGQIRFTPSRADTKAMVRPSGDAAGSRSVPENVIVLTRGVAAGSDGPAGTMRARTSQPRTIPAPNSAAAGNMLKRGRGGATVDATGLMRPLGDDRVSS